MLPRVPQVARPYTALYRNHDSSILLDSWLSSGRERSIHPAG